ncbi:hypothetical protein BCR43DRAFT_496396 [Syncephalastrum racemosum]|uniref:dolichol kinase n=1 Tax=Syncephalastrum racemosum TaxID=13706 RepID=A0A1X2H492_SYNRA|nr:hypothetical protein BCR43DRAFT_496396 [Syncephalastrum racemosum]
MAAVEPYYHANSLERLVWFSSFAWVTYHCDTVAWGFLLLLLAGIGRFGYIRKAPTKAPPSPPLLGKSSSTATSSGEVSENENEKTPSPSRKSASPSSSTSVGVSIFGVSRSAFRADADSGLLCGTILMPMVAMVKAHRDRTEGADVKLDLVLLLTVLFLVLIILNRYVSPVKRRFRKRGLFVLSVMLASLFTYAATRKCSRWLPFLAQVPLSITIMTVTAFLWSLYIAAIALKRCFTLGEMAVLSQAAAILTFSSLEYIYNRFFSFDTYEKPMETTHAASVLLNAVVLGMVVIGMVSYPLLRRARRLAQIPYWRSSPSTLVWSRIQKRKVIVACAFYAVTALIIFFVIEPVTKAILGQEPVLWTLSFVFFSPSRLLLCGYWAFAVGATVVAWLLVLDFNTPVSVESKTLTATLNKKRKLFHALAVVMFVPGVLFEHAFLQLAFGVALSTFIYLEYLRYFAVWPYGNNIHVFLTEFIDNRDLGPVILSHIYLLLGCAAPVWLGNSENVLASLTGILTLGFGDTAASVIGKQYGSVRWPGTKKTVEGTVAFVVTVFLSSIFIMYTAAFVGIEEAEQFISLAGQSEWMSYAVMTMMAGLLEASSTQNDNIIIPLYMYALVILGLP